MCTRAPKIRLHCRLTKYLFFSLLSVFGAIGWYRYQAEKSLKRPTEVVGNALHKRTGSDGMIIESFLSKFLYYIARCQKYGNELD